MFGIGAPELLFIFLIVLLVFGGKKIPEIARGLGRGVREFKKAKDGLDETEGGADGGKPVTAAKSDAPAAAKKAGPGVDTKG